jgi:aminocarboxymuconate-semialdehyde decarboxylase
MRVVDFHNHYYPPAYLDALQSGSSAVQVSVDPEGNPRIFYPGDYKVAVRGHRDIDYRAQALAEASVDTQVLTLTTHGTHVEERPIAIRLASLVNDAFASAVRDHKGRFAALSANFSQQITFDNPDFVV